MKYDLEKYIVKNIDDGIWKSNSKIPIENELIKITNLSKMSVRKVIDKLKEREILYSIQGKGVYVSPFNSGSKIVKLEEILNATKVTTLPSKSKIPSILLKRFDEEFEFDENKMLTFVKLYFVKDEIVAFTLNWLSNGDDSYNIKDIIKGKTSIYTDKKFNKLINVHKLEETSNSDKNILLTKFEYVPTIYSYYINKNRNITMLRVSKIKPKFYNALEIKNR